ncbi:MAG: hypothetical protein AB7G23_03365 [Vicinamibacterales bacterium]
MTGRRALRHDTGTAPVGTVLAAAVLLPLWVGVVIAGLRSVAPLGTVAAGYVLLVALTGWWARMPVRRRDRHALLLWLATAAFGPFGAAGLMLAMFVERHHAGHATSLEAWHAMLFPPSHVDEEAELWRRIGQRASDRPDAQPVTPFLDVLAFGTVPQRQAVVAIIAQQFRPAFAGALKTALRDEANVVRVQAATAIARLEHEFLERTLRLEQAARDSAEASRTGADAGTDSGVTARTEAAGAASGGPDGRADARATLALASHYDDYAFTGLLDPAREEDCRVRAANGYQAYLAQVPDDRVVAFRLARLQLRRGLPEDAEHRFRELAEAGEPAAAEWQLEALFVMGRYADLRRAAARHAVGPGLGTPEAQDALALWTGREVPA